MNEQYQCIAETQFNTVAADYVKRVRDEEHYQSEADLEARLIAQLQQQGYEYLLIHDPDSLLHNLRVQLERLNHYTFSETEWSRFRDGTLCNSKLSIADKSEMIQEGHILSLECDNGDKKNIYLLDKEQVHNNHVQVINQYETSSGTHVNRYDVTILVNGLPLVHIELKRRGVDIKEAFNQIKRYNRESFWADSGLFEYVQLFVISNGTHSKYYSNSTRDAHVKSNANAQGSQKKQQTSNSFEFTSFWADRNNQVLADLEDFTATFFNKHTLLNILTRYCVFTSDKNLLVMRPYQIAATESILQRIHTATNYKQYGTVKGGGYVWHTTGSGKTLTSFKTARLASRLPFVDKVIFVVDRKDLDYQTMKEYDRFERGAANSNSNTSVLKKQLEDSNARIIITTIQKLSIFINKHKTHEVYDKHIVFIFDECHRSQFGDMHQAIVKKFKKYHLFGFTGTPIFAVNSNSSGAPNMRTTEQAFGDKLHVYTIVDAIIDANVLPFKIDYISTMKEQEKIEDSQVFDIDRERALLSPQRISHIVSYILEHFDQKTKRNTGAYFFNKVQNIGDMAAGRKGVQEEKKQVAIKGFNSIFAVSSVAAAKLYYAEFRKQLEQLPAHRKINVATIYSYAANEDVEGLGNLDDENPENASALDGSSRDFLESAIADYNQTFKTHYDTSAERFQNYYKDVSLRMKNREIDLLIVVNMFLTGFDATTLNTLWVDKNLRMHGLLQAFSRTNRILNSVKTFGNIVCFRDLEDATNKSIALFGDREASGLVLLKTFEEYYFGYRDDDNKYHPGYKELIEQLQSNYPLQQPIVSEEAKKGYIRLFGSILRSLNLLQTFDKFDDMQILSDIDMQDYRSIYLALYDEFRPGKGELANVNDDIVFEMELIKQVDVNIDYILYLIEELHESHTQDKELVVNIQRAVESSSQLRNKKFLIENFIDQLSPGVKVTDAWLIYVKHQLRKELNQFAEQENLNKKEAFNFMNICLHEGRVPTSGKAIVKVLPPISLFHKSKKREEKKNAVLEQFQQLFNKYAGLLEYISEEDNQTGPVTFIVE